MPEPVSQYDLQAKAARAVAKRLGIPEEYVYTYGELMDDPDDGPDITWAAMDGSVYGRYNVYTDVVIFDSE